MSQELCRFSNVLSIKFFSRIPGFINQEYLCCLMNVKSNYKIVVVHKGIHGTTVPLLLSCHPSLYTTQAPYLGKTVSLLWKLPLVPLKLVFRKKALRSVKVQGCQSPHLKFIVSSPIGITFNQSGAILKPSVLQSPQESPDK